MHLTIVERHYTYRLLMCLIFRPVKWNLALNVNFLRESIEGENRTTAYFKSEPAILLNSSQIQLQMEEAISRFDELTESFTNEGSGWKIIGVENLKLCSAIYEPIGANSHIKTPAWVHRKKATVNIQNEDDY